MTDVEAGEMATLATGAGPIVTKVVARSVLLPETCALIVRGPPGLMPTTTPDVLIFATAESEIDQAILQSLTRFPLGMALRLKSRVWPTGTVGFVAGVIASEVVPEGRAGQTGLLDAKRGSPRGGAIGVVSVAEQAPTARMANSVAMVVKLRMSMWVRVLSGMSYSGPEVPCLARIN
jgi:hypothetical protein